MNSLEELHKEIDNSNWNASDSSQINRSFQNINDVLKENNQIELLRLSDRERQVFAFNKSPNNQLSCQMAGTKTNEDGTEVPFEWPDIGDFSQQDFEHILARFETCKNLYSKTEYGLFLFYSGHLMHNGKVLELADALFKLCQKYLDIASQGGDGNHFVLYLNNSLDNLLYITNNRKTDRKLEEFFFNVISFIEKTHRHWNLELNSGMRAIIDLTEFFIKYFERLVGIIDLNNILERNWELAQHLSKQNSQGTIYVADISIRLSRKLKTDYLKWDQIKAEQYEKLGRDSIAKNNPVAASFFQKALILYKKIKFADKVKELEVLYDNQRSESHYQTITEHLPTDEVKRILDNINSFLSSSSDENVVKTLLLTPMISPLERIRKFSEESFKENLLINLLPTSIQDKFGNTIGIYSTEEERKHFSLLKAYDFELQIATTTIVEFFLEAYRREKISTETILGLLSQTWIGTGGERIRDGKKYNIPYLDLIKPSLISLFYELQNWMQGPDYIPNFISCTDSLILKIEYMLREFCRKVGIATFRPNSQNSSIMEEKTLSDLMSSLKNHISEDDFFFIHFVLMDKAGLNLRNRIAHGLLDAEEYGIEFVLLSLICLLKISNYEFIPNGNETTI
jgi:hypothetical protein